MTIQRRDFLKTTGMLIAGLHAGGITVFAAQVPQNNAGPYTDPDFRKLDSWIVIHENNTASFYVGKTDCGQGTGTAFRQLMADELDIPYEKTECFMGTT